MKLVFGLGTNSSTETQLKKYSHKLTQETNYSRALLTRAFICNNSLWPMNWVWVGISSQSSRVSGVGLESNRPKPQPKPTPTSQLDIYLQIKEWQLDNPTLETYIGSRLGLQKPTIPWWIASQAIQGHGLNPLKTFEGGWASGPKFLKLCCHRTLRFGIHIMVLMYFLTQAAI